MRPPYIGVTGFMQRSEVSAVLDGLSGRGDHQLMIGVLASSKTLSGARNKWPNRYPPVEDIAGVFPPDRRTVNLIHYATDDPPTLSEQLERLIRLGGEWLDGFQLNIRWPEPGTIPAMPKGMRIVLQLGPQALKDASGPGDVAARLDAYRGRITDVLVDMSGGLGVPIDTDAAQAYVQAICDRHPRIGIGVAGGLSTETIDRLAPLVSRFPFLSMDAEGRLRTEDDELDRSKAKAYVAAATALFK